MIRGSERLAPAVSGGMADVDTTAAAAIATAAADISAATAAVVTVAIAAIVVVATAAERASDHAGHDAANDRLGDRRAVLIVDLLDGGVRPHHLRSGRVDRY